MIADGLTQFSGEAFAQIKRIERKLAAIKSRIRPGRIELQRGEPLRQIFTGTFRRQVGIVIDIAFVAGARVDIGVGAQSFVNPAPQQLVNWLARFLADDIPTRHFEGAQHAHQGQIRMLGEAAGVNPPPHAFDVMRIIAANIAIEHILDHLRHQMRRERHAIGLANARDVAIGGQLDEHEVTAAEMRRRVADDERLYIDKLHNVTASKGNPLMTLRSR